jgi:cytochrome c-type biogenesis protein CcmF
VTEGERFSVKSREAALVFNNVMLSAILGIVLIGTLYPLVTEAMGEKVSVGPPYFNPVSAVFAIPMLLVLMVGPLLRWRNDNPARHKSAMLIALALIVLSALVFAFGGHIAVMPLLGLALAPALAVASVLPLRGRKLRLVPLATWGMVVAHFGVAVALAGMACDSAFSQQHLIAARPGETTTVGPWTIRLARVSPVAGPNWTAMEGELEASYAGGAPVHLRPQSRMFWAPPQNTTVSALHTRWNGQLYTVMGDEVQGTQSASPDGTGRWQLRLWWKPFVPLIWYGGGLIALGGLLALLGRVADDLRRIRVKAKVAYRREQQGRGPA